MNDLRYHIQSVQSSECFVRQAASLLDRQADVDDRRLEEDNQSQGQYDDDGIEATVFRTEDIARLASMLAVLSLLSTFAKLGR
jgi:hypothetical protein